MQDGKALQAGTSHYLGTNFAEAQNIRFQNAEGSQSLAHTTSWGVSTRMVGGVIMTHGDDDGLRVPPKIAPWQIAIVPMLRDTDEDAAVLDYAKALAKELNALTAFGEPVRALVDVKAIKASNKRWNWVKKGAPLIVEIGPRDVAGGNVALLRRDKLYAEGGKLATSFVARAEFVDAAAALLEEIQQTLRAEARARLDASIERGVTDWAGVEAHFAEGRTNPGWLEIAWSKPTGAALDAVVEKLKALKLTIRNAPLGGVADGTCLFAATPAVEHILIGRAY